MFPMLRSSSRQVLRTALNKGLSLAKAVYRIHVFLSIHTTHVCRDSATHAAWIIKNSSRPLVDTPGVLGTALHRKRILTSKPDDHIISGRDPAAFLQKFLYDHPVWGHPDVHVYWKQPGWKHLQMKDYMVSSVQVCFSLICSIKFSCLHQLSGTCWLHAAVVLQHLLVVKDSGKADHKKVLSDICFWLTSHY